MPPKSLLGKEPIEKQRQRKYSYRDPYEKIALADFLHNGYLPSLCYPTRVGGIDKQQLIGVFFDLGSSSS